MSNLLKVGTRGSELALRQTQLVIDALKNQFSECSFEIVKVQTLGDKKQGTPQAAFGDKKDWIVGLEDAIISGEIDFAVHSAKDVPIDISEETLLLPVLERKSAIDILILKNEVLDKNKLGLEVLPQGSILGTASLRRQAQIQSFRKDLKISALRGNVPTRIKKLDENKDYDAIVVAQAGVERLGAYSSLGNRAVCVPIEQIIPAVNQGMLVAQFSKSRIEIQTLLTSLVDKKNYLNFLAERACIGKLGADCKSAVGVYSEIKENVLFIRSGVFSVDGSKSIFEVEKGNPENAISLGDLLANKLLEKGAADLLK